MTGISAVLCFVTMCARSDVLNVMSDRSVQGKHVSLIYPSLNNRVK